MLIATTISGVIVFSGVILLLVILLNYAQSKLLPQDNVSLIINDKGVVLLKVVLSALHILCSISLIIELSLSLSVLFRINYILFFRAKNY